MELTRASGALARRVYLLALGALIMGALVYVWAVRQPATYQAKAQVVVTLHLEAAMTPAQLDYTVALARQSAAAPLPDHVVADIHNAVPTRTMPQIRKALSLGMLAGQPVVVVTARDADPAVAVALANSAALTLAGNDEVAGKDARAALADQIATLQMQLGTVTKQITQTQAQIATAKANQQDTTTLEATLSTQQASQQQILNQLGSAQAAYARPQAHFWVSQVATAAEPVGLVEPAASLVGAVVGLLGGAAAALLLDLLDGMVRGPRDTERFAGLRTIASLAEPLSDDEALSMVRPEDYFTLAGAYQDLLRNLAFLDATQRVRTVLVAAADGTAGADIVGIKLAITCARDGQRTLVVDANWNLPSLEARFGLPTSQRGLFTGMISMAPDPVRALDAIVATDIPGLAALPLGPLPPNLDELMRTPLLDQLLQLLAERFQQIVVLAPPQLDSVAGRQLIERMDGVLVVVRAGATTGADLADTAKLLRRANAFLAGAVLTNVDVSAVPVEAQAAAAAPPAPPLDAALPSGVRLSSRDMGIPPQAVSPAGAQAPPMVPQAPREQPLA
ncbi:MAG TPA: hypothetical protein VFU88_07905 [Ktedonobacterales bacterium]|nr:hypothetical protein [Ktedonobacterales bacterium]